MVKYTFQLPTPPFPLSPEHRAQGFSLQERLTIVRRITKAELGRMEKIDWLHRFSDRALIEKELEYWVPAYGGEEAQVHLDQMADDLRFVNPVPIFRKVLRQTGSHPDDIIAWLKRAVLHVNYHNIEIQSEGGRALRPVETLFVGLGGCGTFANLAAVLLQCAGIKAWVWDVVGHSFIEYELGGRRQLEDVDLRPSEHRMPRGLDMQSLLENYNEWKFVLDALPIVGWAPASQVFVPSNDSGIVYQRQKWSVRDGFTSHEGASHVGGIARIFFPIQQHFTPLEGGGFCLSYDDIPMDSEWHAAICLFRKPPVEVKRIGSEHIGDKRQHDCELDRSIEDITRRLLSEADQVIWTSLTSKTPSSNLKQEGGGAWWYAVLLFPSGQLTAFPYWNRECSGWIESKIQEQHTTDTVSGEALSIREMDATILSWDRAYRNFRESPPVGCEAGARYARNFENGLIGTMQSISALGLPDKGTALDAGCGTGEWALALSMRFDRVHAIDRSTERIRFFDELIKTLSPRPVIKPILGDLVALPYANDQFDFIFCNGVLFSTPTSDSLNEFYRVLRPGGVVFCWMNADGWNLHLRKDQGRKNADAHRQGRDTLYNTAWRRYGVEAVAILQNTQTEWRKKRRPEIKNENSSEYLEQLLTYYQKVLSALSLEERQAIRRLELHARMLCGEDHLQIILNDIIAMGCGDQTSHTVTVKSESWLPDELRQLTCSIGFEKFCWAPYRAERTPEGCHSLIGKDGTSLGMAESTGTRLIHYHGELASWDCEFRKPI